MIKTLGNNIVSAFTGGNPVKAIYAYGQLVWPISGPEPTGYYIKWTPSTAEGQFNIDGTTYDLSAFSGTYYWSTGIINPSAFQNNYSVQSIETNATSIGFRAFMSCSSLSQVSLPMCSYIDAAVFRYCSSLSRITIGYSSVCSLYSTNVFDDTQITSSTGSIYVPASLVDAYKSAENWSVYSNIIYPIN